jgi:hypothetical protein
MKNVMIVAEELAIISSYQIAIKHCQGTKLEKLLSNHEARFISWRIYAPLVVKLLIVK